MKNTDSLHEIVTPEVRLQADLIRQAMTSE